MGGQGDPLSFAYSSAHLFTPTSVRKLKIPFQTPSDEKALFFGAKGSANHLALLSLCHPVMPPQWPTLPSLSNRAQVTECWQRLSYILTALAVSPWGLLVQTQRVGEFIFPFPLSEACHVTVVVMMSLIMLLWLLWYINYYKLSIIYQEKA